MFTQDPRGQLIVLPSIQVEENLRGQWVEAGFAKEEPRTLLI